MGAADYDFTNKDSVLKLVANTPNMYFLLPDELKNDKDVIYASLTKYHELDFVLASIPLEAFDSVHFKKQCLALNPYLCLFIPGMADDKDTILDMVSRRGLLFDKVHSPLREDLDVILAALVSDGRVLRFLDDELKSDFTVLIAAFKGRDRQAGLVHYAPVWLQNDDMFVDSTNLDIEDYLAARFGPGVTRYPDADAPALAAAIS